MVDSSKERKTVYQFMEHLLGCLESESLSVAMFQSFLDHSRLLISYGFHSTLFGNILCQKSIKVLVAAALPTEIRIGNVGLDAQGLIDGLVGSKLHAVDDHQSSNP